MGECPLHIRPCTCLLRAGSRAVRWAGHFARHPLHRKGIRYAARHPSLTCLAFPRSPVLLPPQNGSAATDCAVAHPRHRLCSAAVRLRSRAQPACCIEGRVGAGPAVRHTIPSSRSSSGRQTTVAAPPRSPALARLPGSAREINCRCSVHHVSSQVVLSAAIVSAQLVSVRRRRRRLEDTCAQRGGRALRMSLGWG